MARPEDRSCRNGARRSAAESQVYLEAVSNQLSAVSYLAILSCGEESGRYWDNACDVNDEMLHSVQHDGKTLNLGTVECRSV